MDLAPGNRLGSYEIVATLGAGGMGRVYRARDTRLGRSVAIKLLRGQAAHDARLRQRLEQEAQAVSRLNHPRICTLYDVGRHDGHDFLVMELVEGETLAQCLRRGPLPLDLALRHAVEVAEALDHAHQRGITHRDLKPANIMLTRSGAKLLDFGVAKLREPASEATDALDRALATRAIGSDAASAAHTAAGPLTELGELLGTFEYMAPEQLQGHEADARTDVFAFGAVLYEMLTGQQAFEAATPAAVIGAVLMGQPVPLRERQPAVPDLLDRIVRQCLAKDPDERWQSMRDLLVPLRWTRDGVAAPAATERMVPRLRRWGAPATGAAVAALVGLLLWSMAPVTPPRDQGRWDIVPPPGGSFAAHLAPALAMSPDGRELVFRARTGATTQLYVRPTDNFVARALPGTEEAHTPFFSPDGRWVGFVTSDRIYKVSRANDSVIRVGNAGSLSPGSPGATWGPHGTIVFAAGVSGLMHIADAEGSIPEWLTVPDTARGEVIHMYPQFLPGGTELLFTVRTTDDSWRLAILSMETRQWDWLPPLGHVAGARYVDPGYILYAQAGGLFAVPFDRHRRAFGQPMALPETVYTHAVADAVVAQFAVSDTGRLAYMSGTPPEWTLVGVSLETDRVVPITSDARGYRYPRFSPTGDQLVVSIEEARSDIYLVDAFSGSLQPLTRTGSNTHPSWTPDGTRVSFSSRRQGSRGFDLYWAPVDRSREAEPLVSRNGSQFLTGWLRPDGDQFAFYEFNQLTERDVWVWSRDQEEPIPVLRTGANERGAIFSPDGRMIAFVSNETGRDEVWVQPFPGPGGAVQVSRSGGGEPVWSPTGPRLFYRDEHQLWTVDLAPGPPVQIQARRSLFDDPYVRAPSQAGRANYDIHPNGRELVMIRSVDRATTELRVVDDWRR